MARNAHNAANAAIITSTAVTPSAIQKSRRPAVSTPESDPADVWFSAVTVEIT